MGIEEEYHEALPKVSYVREFYYDPARRLFVVGDEDESMSFALSEIKDSFDLNSETLSLQKDLYHFDGRLIGLGPFGHVVEYPEMRKWIAGMTDIGRRELEKKVKNEIRKAWNVLNPKLSLTKKGAERFIDAAIFDDGTFILNTFGNCACLGRTPDLWTGAREMFSESNLDTLVGNALHNADTPAQRLSLYAGVGSLAWLMREYTVNK